MFSANQTLSGKTVFITGAAGGIGQVLCTLFAELGATVIAVDRDQQRLSAFVAASAAKGVRLQSFCADITDEKAVAAGRRPSGPSRPGGSRPACAPCRGR